MPPISPSPADETRAFLDALEVELPPAVFQVLLDRTEGWAAGLRLFTLSQRGSPTGSVDALLDDSAAVDYLVQEAFARSPRRPGVSCCRLRWSTASLPSSPRR